jgi:hypothetical protein
MFSNVRNADPGPNGWDFRDIHAWKSLDSDWFFVPWANVKTNRVISSTPVAYAGDTQGKLVVNAPQDLQNDHRGSGIVVDAVALEAVGCYKTLELARPDEWRELGADRMRLIE